MFLCESMVEVSLVIGNIGINKSRFVLYGFCYEMSIGKEGMCYRYYIGMFFW